LWPIPRVKTTVEAQDVPSNISISGLHIFLGGGQPAQHTVRMRDMNGEIHILTPRVQLFAYVHLLKGGNILYQLCIKSLAWPPSESSKFMTSIKRDEDGSMSWQFRTPQSSRRACFSQCGFERREWGALETWNKPNHTEPRASLEPRIPWQCEASIRGGRSLLTLRSCSNNVGPVRSSTPTPSAPWGLGDDFRKGSN
jgi:hypothetical protein